MRAQTFSTQSTTITHRNSSANPAVTEIQNHPNQKPGSEWLSQLKPKDQFILLSSYQKAELTNKLSLTIALAFVGDDAVASEFKKTILEGKKQLLLNAEEKEVILFTIEGLGLLAGRSDSAWAFLNAGTDPSYWKQNIHWRLDDETDPYGLLARRAVTALGYTSRPEVEQLFSRLQKDPFVPDGARSGWVLDGALVDGAFFHDLLEQRGVDYLKTIYGSDVIVREFQKWKETENGRKWMQWRDVWRRSHPNEIAKAG